MNEKQAVAYGQIALDSLLNSTYKNKVNLENFALEQGKVAEESTDELD